MKINCAQFPGDTALTFNVSIMCGHVTSCLKQFERKKRFVELQWMPSNSSCVFVRGFTVFSYRLSGGFMPARLVFTVSASHCVHCCCVVVYRVWVLQLAVIIIVLQSLEQLRRHVTFLFFRSLLRPMFLLTLIHLVWVYFYDLTVWLSLMYSNESSCAYNPLNCTITSVSIFVWCCHPEPVNLIGCRGRNHFSVWYLQN